MTNQQQAAFVTAVCFLGFLLILLIACGLRYFEWAMLALGGNFR